MRGGESSPFSATLVTQYFPPERGAAQVRLGSIVKDLMRRGHRADVVTALPNYPTGHIFPGWSHRPLQIERNEEMILYRVWIWAAMGSGLGRVLNYLTFAFMSVVGLLSAEKADLVIVEYPTLFGALPAVVVARLRRQRLVILVADLWVDSIVETGTMNDGSSVRALRWVESWMLRQADVVTAVTEGVRDALLGKKVDKARLAWLPNGADTELFSPGDPDPKLSGHLGLGDDEQMILYAGTHGFVHGLDIVLDAAEMLEDVPVRFVLVGDGSEKSTLVNSAKRRGLRNVTFLDPVSPEEVAVMLRGATAGLATVRAGDVYRTVRSAKMFPVMSTGLPLIYSGSDEGSKIVRDAGAGIVTEAGDAGALAAAVREIVASPDHAREMGKAGRNWVETNASWHELIDNWLEQIDKISRATPLRTERVER